LLLIVLCACTAIWANQEPDVESWIRDHTVPLRTVEPGGAADDLKFLEPLLEGRRIVSFGEGRHGAHEFLALRNRLFEFLVREHGFTAIALETDFSDAMRINRYLHGESDFDERFVVGLFSFGGARLEENLQLLTWIRNYNANMKNGRQISVYGLDMMGKSTWMSSASPMFSALDACLAYIGEVDPSAAKEATARINDFRKRIHNAEQYDQASEADQNGLTAEIARIASLYERNAIDWSNATSRQRFSAARQLALNALWADADLRARGWWSARRDGDHRQRDAAMASNLMWALEQEGANGRILAFSHAGHAMKGRLLNEPSFRTMGEYLHSAVGDRLLVIGSTYSEGRAGRPGHVEDIPAPARESLNHALAGAGTDLYALNLRQIEPASIRSWWNDAKRIEHRVSGPYRYYETPPAAAFDVIVFVRRLTAVE